MNRSVKLCLTTWCNQNSARRALCRLAVSTSTTELGKLFQMLTIRAQKEHLLRCNEKKVIIPWQTENNIHVNYEAKLTGTCIC